MIDLYKNTIDIDYMRKIIRMSERYPERRTDLWDSISENQFISKSELLKTLLESDILNKDLSVVIIGSWYGSILIPVLAPLVKEIDLFDIDVETQKVASNMHDYDNLTFSTLDVTEKQNKSFRKENDLLIINTSCEHMGSMDELIELQRPWRSGESSNKQVWFAFQSNNMYGIEGHINCKDTLQDFKNDLPIRNLILEQKEIEEERGVRFFLFGKVVKPYEMRADGTYYPTLENRLRMIKLKDILKKKEVQK